ncbi:hypothetical protein Tco_0809419 [Tanacetum coccineum]
MLHSKELASPKQTALGKDFSNPLIVDSLLKTIWLSMHHVVTMKHWLFQSKRLLLVWIIQIDPTYNMLERYIQTGSTSGEDEFHDDNPPLPPPVTPTQQAPHTLSTIKLPILKKGVSPEDTNQSFLVFESDVKGFTASSSSTQNVAFVSSKSTSSTNDVDELDLEEMDLKWQVAMISMRLKKFYKNTGRKLQFDAKKPVGFDKTKGNGRKLNLVTIDGDGVDWTVHAEDEQENFALMAYSNSGSNSEMSAKDKSGLRYGDQIHEGVLSYENEVLESVFDSRSSDVEDSPVYDRFAKVEECMSSPPMTGIYMPPKYDFGIDELNFTYGPKQSKTINTARQNLSSQAAATSTARKVNTARPIVNEIRPRNNFYKSHSPIRRQSNRTTAPKANFANHKVNTAGTKQLVLLGAIGKLLLRPQQDDPQKALKNKEIVDSGCFRHMTGNKAYLVEYQDYNGGPVAFGGSKGQITGKGKGPNWLFDLDYLTDSMNYQPVTAENKANKTAGPKEANHSAGTQDNIDAGNSEMEAEPAQEYFALPISTASPSRVFSAGGPDLTNNDQDDSQIPALEEIFDNPSDGIFTNASYDDEGAVADFTNLETTMNVSPIPTSRIHSIHPITQILGDPTSAVQTRSKVNKSFGAHAFVSYIQKQRRNNHKDFQHCLFACFLSQIEPKKISQALEDESWVDAMQEELLQFKIKKVWILANLPFRKKLIGTKWVYRNKKDERGVVVRNKESSSNGCVGVLRVWTIEEEVYVSLPLDDMIFGLQRKSWCDDFEASDEEKIIMGSYGRAHLFLGITEILKKFDFDSVKTASTLIETQKPLIKDEEAADVDVLGNPQHEVRQFHGRRIISWQMHETKTIVDTSTSKAEFVALCQLLLGICISSGEAKWLVDLLYSLENDVEVHYVLWDED